MPPARKPPSKKRRRSQAEITAEAVAAAVAIANAAATARNALIVAAAITNAQTAASTKAAAETASAVKAAAATREQSWICGICQDLYEKPATTPCGHTFCLGCIKKALEMRGCCPLCQTYVTQTLPLAVNIAMQEFIAANAGPLFVARKAEKTGAFSKLLFELNPVAAIAALSLGVDHRCFVGNAALKLTPLLWACKNAKGDKYLEWNNLIKALLTAGADVNALDSEGKSALYLAADSNDANTWITAIPALLDRGARDPSALSKIVLSATVNLTAEYINAIDVVLLRMAVDVSYSHLTLTQKRVDLASILKNGYDRTAVALFDQGVRLEEPHKMLHWAASGGCSLFIRKLLAAKVVPVDHVFENRQTALHVACFTGQEKAALALLECGSVFGFDDFNRRPLDYAKKNGLIIVVEALKAKGAVL